MKKLTKKIVSALLVVGMAAVFMTGCGQNTSDNGGSSEKKAANQHINALLAYMEPGLDPSNGNYAWVTVRCGVTECLLKLNDKVELEPWIATEVKNVDDTTWEITIRDNVKFSNGTAVDAEAVKKCFERTLSKSESAKDYSKIASMEADGQKLTVKTSEPNAAFKNNLTEPVFSIYDATQSDEDIDKAVIGTGPFVVTGFVPEQSVELKRNENYWDGEVGLETVSLKYVLDAEAKAMALQSGETDLATNVDRKDADVLEKAGKHNVDSVYSLRVYIARMNVKDVSPLHDVELRKAVSYAADRENYAKLIGGSAAHSFYSDSTPFGNDKINAISYNKEKAIEILDAAGYKDVNGDGIRENKDGKPMKLKFMQSASFGSGDAGIIATAYQASLKEVGIDMEIQTMEGGHSEPDTYYDFYTTQGNTAITGDPEFYLKKLYGPKGTGYRSEKMDKILEQFKTTFDTEERYKLGQQAAQLANDDAADVYLVNGYLKTVSAKKIKNAKQPVVDFYFLTKDMVVEE